MIETDNMFGLRKIITMATVERMGAHDHVWPSAADGRGAHAWGECHVTSEVAISSASAQLGLELRRLRMENGISQRSLTRLIGLSAHSNLSDYERGRRIPPADIVQACERLLQSPPGYLQDLRYKALTERARQALS